jgi:hypothetical protein
MKRHVIALALIALVLTSCSDDDSDDTSGQPTDSNDAFTTLLLDSSRERARVTYLSQQGNGPEDAFTRAQDGSGTVAYITDTQRFVLSAAGVTVCDNATPPTCTEPDGSASGALNAYVTVFDMPARALAGVGPEGIGEPQPETIAGREATCAAFAVDNQPIDVCLDKETGVLLRFSGSDQGQLASTEATGFEEPDDADFATT